MLDHVLFVGLGGAGQRHLRILRQLLPAARFTAYRTTRLTPMLNSDFSAAPDKSLEDTYDLKIRRDLAEALAERPDLAVIANPTSHHFVPMMEAIRGGAGVLVEKPWSDSATGFSEFASLVRDRKTSFRISFQRRYHPLLRYAQELVASKALGKIISANFVCGSYMPAWHPYENWRNLYAARADLGGGVLLTEIHELDLCHWYFGLPKTIFCQGGCYGPEPLDVEDTVHVICDYVSFAVHISLCFMQQRTRRCLEIAGTRGHLAWDADDNRLVHIDYESGRREERALPGLANDSMFEAQARDFVEGFNIKSNEEHLHMAWASQVMADCARQSMQTRTVIALPSYPQASNSGNAPVPR